MTNRPRSPYFIALCSLAFLAVPVEAQRPPTRIQSGAAEPYRARAGRWADLVVLDPEMKALDLPGDSNGLATLNFRHLFNTPMVNAGAESQWKGIPHVWPSLDAPGFVQSVALFLEESLAAYRGFPAPATQANPMLVRYIAGLTYLPRAAERLGPASDLMRRHPASYVHDDHEIRISIDRRASGQDPSLLRQRAAHELFHAVQNKMLGGGTAAGALCVKGSDAFWWIEASADYASANLATGRPELMGKSYWDIYPYLLEYPLSRSGAPTNDHALPKNQWNGEAELEYMKAYFISHMVGRGEDFTALHTAVMNYAKTHRGPHLVLDALNDYFTNRRPGVSLGRRYQEFAAWFLLSDGSPLARQLTAADSPPSPLISVVRTISGSERAADVMPVQSRPGPPPALEYTFPMDVYNARLWAIKADPGVFGRGRPAARWLRITALTLTPFGLASAQVFVAGDGARLGGEPAPLLNLTRPGAVGEASLSSGQLLYVLVTATDHTQRGHAVVKVEDITPGPAPPPPPASTPAPTASSALGSGTGRGGYWRFIESRAVKYAPNPASGLINVSMSVSDGSISGTATDPGGGDGPSTWAGACTWNIQSPSGLDRLMPGDVIEASMSVTDRSVPEKGSGWNHGRVGVVGGLRFDRPLQELGVSHHAASDIVNAGATWQKSNPRPTDDQRGRWTVPAGPVHPEWGGKAALDANCSFGRFERIYEWTIEPYRPARASPDPRPSTTPSWPSLAGAWSGRWTNALGEQGADSLVLEETPDGSLSGTWSGSVSVNGRRLSATRLTLAGRTATREYEVSGTFVNGVLTLTYEARRLDSGGSYRGTSEFTR
jgi:hypothetical protein